MISVVIPLYNKEHSIERTIQSVLNQSYLDYELIVVNDGSTDKSLEVVMEFVGRIDNRWIDDRLTLIHKENGGVSSARNRGIRDAKGEYVAFLDGDDIWDKDFLKEMVRLIEDYPGRSIYGLGCEQIKRGEKPVLKDSYYRGESGWSYDTMAFTGSSACVNKKDAIAVGLFDTRMTHGEDLDLWWRLMLLHGGASYMKPYAYYIQDAENRAMHRLAPLQKHIPYYVDKFAEARAKDMEFRRFFDKEMIQRLYPYLLDKRYRKKAKELVNVFDYALQKGSLKWRLKWPRIYWMYRKIIGI